MAGYTFEIVTAEREVVSAEVELVLLPTVDGLVGVLKNHAPLLTALKIGIIEYGPRDAKKRKAAISGGFAEMNDNKLTVFANSSELGEEIDILRAKEAHRRAEQRLQQKQEELDFHRARVALEKALARIQAAEE